MPSEKKKYTNSEKVQEEVKNGRTLQPQSGGTKMA